MAVLAGATALGGALPHATSAAKRPCGLPSSQPLWIDFDVRLVVTIVVAVCTGLVQVELAYRFIEADVEDNRPATS